MNGNISNPKVAAAQAYFANLAAEIHAAYQSVDEVGSRLFTWRYFR